MHKLVFLGLSAVAIAMLVGCRVATHRVVTQMSSGNDSDTTNLGDPTKPADDPKAVVFLKHSMDVYSTMPSYTAEGSFSSGPKGELRPHQTRKFAYSKPNRFKVVSDGHGFLQTSICDGKNVLEFDNETGQTPRKEPAPDSIAEVRSMQMRHPMFCGTLLYQFFGGSANFDGLVDAEKDAVTFGAEEKASTGEQAHLVKFYGKQQYGHVEALIGEKTAFVYRIKYDSEPLMKMMQDPETQKTIRAASESALNQMKDETKKAQAKTALSMGKDVIPTSLITEETYTNISTPTTIAEGTFALNAPVGTTPVEMPASRTPSDKPPIALGSVAPSFSVNALDGKTVSLSQLRGHPVLLDFWATWCGPCVASLPHTQELFTKGKALGLQVLAISNEDRATVSKFIQDNKYTFPTGLDSSGGASRAYKTDAIPTTVVIDAQGKLVAYIVGGGQDDAIKKALAKVGVTVD